MKKSGIMRKIFKVSLLIICSIVTLFVLVWGGLNIFKFAIYSEYFSIKENVCKNPGLGDGFVPQGIAVSDNEDLILTSGYMDDGTSSRIYITNSKNESRYVKLVKNGSDFVGHSGGIALHKDTIYLASDEHIFTLSLSEIRNVAQIDIGEGIKVNNAASYVFSDENYLYVGEFNNSKEYVTNHFIDNNDGGYHAICSAYDFKDLTKPVKIYSIRDKVQGFCVGDDGRIILSTSYGLSDSYFYIYHKDNIRLSNDLYDGCQLYILDTFSKKIKAPAMFEDLDYKDGRVYSLSESACNKYMFGKFFFANDIVSLKL